jgi:NaMN:DMB phosphoribosyltransferase
VEWVVREGVEAGGEMTQALYAHMNNKTIKTIYLSRDSK